MKSIRDFNIAEGDRVLVRCDFNVPMDGHFNIAEDFKIKESLPTIEYLMKKGARVILMSHLDPKKQGVASKEYTLAAVAKKLSEYLSHEVELAPDCVGEDIATLTKKMGFGQVLLLENLRFHEGEKANDPQFAKQLSELGDVFVNDAFAECHRKVASMVGINQYVPSFAGLLLMKEVENLNKILENPAKPFIAVIGGAKVETKANLIEQILKIADSVIVSGLIKKEILDQKLPIGASEKILGPADNLTALDIDEKAIDLFKEKILSAKTVLWNGPFGRFEDQEYKKGTLAIARAIIESKAFSVVGGGETVEFLTKEGLLSSFSHVSTGGGAMLAYLSGESMPALEILQ